MHTIHRKLPALLSFKYKTHCSLLVDVHWSILQPVGPLGLDIVEVVSVGVSVMSVMSHDVTDEVIARYSH